MMASDGVIESGDDDVSRVESSRESRITGIEPDEKNRIGNVELDTGSGDMNTEPDLSEGLMNISDGGEGNISMESNTNSEAMNTEPDENSQDKELNLNEDDGSIYKETFGGSESVSLESTIKTGATNIETAGDESAKGICAEVVETLCGLPSTSNGAHSTNKSLDGIEQPIQVPQATASSVSLASNSGMTVSNNSTLTITNSAGAAKAQGNYEELSEIGNGAYGTVYKARDLMNEGRVVALKKIRISLSDEGVPVNAIREIAMLKQLERYEHPNIVKLLDICHGQLERESRLTLILVFEYMEQDLDHYLKRCPSPGLEPTRIKSIMHQILCGVDFLHSNRIIHRDLKPQNVLVDGQGRVKLADFGLARIYDFYMRLTTTVVTLWYRAPEVLLSNSYATPVDVWSCGCIFAELFRRSPIFEGRTEGDQLQIIFDTIGTPSEAEWPSDVSLQRSNFREHCGKPLKDVVPEITKDAADLLMKMITFRPEVRIQALNAKSHRYFSGMVAPKVTANSATRTTPTQQMISGSQYSTSNIVNAGLSEAKLNSSAVPASSTNDENNPNSGNTHSQNNVANISNSSIDTNLADNNNVVSKMSDDLGHSSASNSRVSLSPISNTGSKDENQDTREVIR